MTERRCSPDQRSGCAPALRLIRELSLALRERVLPHLGAHAGRAHGNTGAGGDTTFAIDKEAEEELERFLAQRAPELAFYSEDRGLVEPSGGAEHVLVVDPIDGTRPAMAGLESCCVSVAAAPLPDPTMADVSVACVVEIPSGAVFLAERGRGVLEAPAVALSENDDLSRLFWTYGFRGRPARALTAVLAELIDGSSVGGGTFELGSAAFDMTRVVTGQLDAYVEPGPLLVNEVPGMREEFERVGGGAVLNNSPYDLAAAALICEEAGAIVTDARGEPLAGRPLLGSGADFQMSVVVSANDTLHGRILDSVARGLLSAARGGP
jgi:myo-inositol-1(or 4)-monophosphatase